VAGSVPKPTLTLAGLAEPLIGSLLASDLKDAAVAANSVAQDTPLFDGQGQRFLQEDVLAGFGSGNGRQSMPVVGRYD